MLDESPDGLAASRRLAVPPQLHRLDVVDRAQGEVKLRRLGEDRSILVDLRRLELNGASALSRLDGVGQRGESLGRGVDGVADKRLVAHALNRGGDDGRDANAQLAVVGEEFACVASRLDVRRGEPVLRRDLGVGRELVGVGPASERRVLHTGARWEEENDVVVVDALSDERRGVPLGGGVDQPLPVFLVALVRHHLHCLSVGAR